MGKTTLYLVPRMGIVPEVSAQTYGTLAKAIREYVTNAVDATAKNIWITFSADSTGRSTLDIRDDGAGMTLNSLQSEFLALGGSSKFDDPASIGRIGIGFLAIVPLCNSITILTKAADSSQVLRAQINTSTMTFPEVRRESISRQPIGEAEILDDSEAARAVQALGTSFTVFTLEGLKGDVTDEFKEPARFTQFRDELRYILPIPWPASAPLKKHISGRLWETLRSKAAEHSINVYLNDPKKPLTRRLYGENASRETFLYTQEFLEKVMVVPSKDDGQLDEIRVTGFLVCDEPTAGKPTGAKLTGVIARFQNVAVEEGTFFGLVGKEERKKRLSGELFIDGLNKNRAMTLNRNQFNQAYRPVIMLNSAMSVALGAFFAGINRVWKARSRINRGVREVKSVVGGVESALRTIHQLRGDPKAERNAKWSKPPLLKHPPMKSFSVLTDAVKASHLSMSVEKDYDSDADYRIELEDSPHEELKGVVVVGPMLADPSRAKFVIGDIEYGLVVVSGTEIEPPCALDVRNRFVVLNDTHPLVRSGDKTLTEMIVFISYAEAVCNTASQMKDLLMQLMVKAKVVE